MSMLAYSAELEIYIFSELHLHPYFVYICSKGSWKFEPLSEDAINTKILWVGTFFSVVIIGPVKKIFSA